MVTEKKERKPLILKQKPMLQVIYALIPLCLAAVFFFGWRFAAVLLVVNIAGFFSEYLFARIYKNQVTSAVFVTSFLFALSLPPTIPLWIAVVGIVFGVVFAKMAFGGFGRNVFNPAISGRAFVYVSFGLPLTSRFVEPVWRNSNGFGGFSLWQASADTVTRATPLVKLAGGETIPILDLLVGNTAGSFGETSALLIIICGLYLIVRKTANYRIVLAGLFAFLIFKALLWTAGVAGTTDPVRSLLSGSFLFVLFFMATDPVSSSQTTNKGRYIFGAVFGLLVPLIRTFSAWPEGTTFAILLTNTFAPLIDYFLKASKRKAAVR